MPDNSTANQQEDSSESFSREGQPCVAKGYEKRSMGDYFKLGCSYTRSGQQRGGIVRTPMPREPVKDEDEENEEDDEDDEDDEEEDEEDYEYHDKEHLKTSQVADIDIKLRSILLHDSNTIQRNLNRVSIQSPV